MYNPATRLLTVLELLQTHPGLSGAEMARRLEVAIRSVRRYVTMLQDMGMPVEASRGPGGGYQLRPGFKLPPLLFTEDEAAAVILGLMGTQWLQIDVDAAAVEGALAKVYRVLPLAARERLQSISAHIAVLPQGYGDRPDADLLVGLSDAIRARRRVCFAYRAESKVETERDVDPYGVVGWRGRWYMVGYCHLRRGLRIFRLDRMAGVQALKASVAPPEDFDPLAYVAERLGGAANPWPIAVEFQAALEEVQGKIPAEYGRLTATPTGVLYEARHWDLPTLARYLVLVDLPFTVREPPELRAALAELAEKVTRLAQANAVQG